MNKQYKVPVYVLALLLMCAMQTAGAMTVSVDDASGDYTTAVDIPINVSGASDVGAMDISLMYNSSVLSPTGIVDTGDLTVGALVINESTIYVTETGIETISEENNQTVWDYGVLANYTGTSGVVNISIICNATDVGFNGAGSVAVIRFTVIGSSGDNSLLSLNVSAYNVSEPIVNTTTENVTGYEEIPITLSNGTFTATGDGGPSTDGNINGKGGVTLADAIYLAKHVAGMSGYGTLSADGNINGKGGVTLADAIYLAKHVAGMTGYGTLYPET